MLCIAYVVYNYFKKTQIECQHDNDENNKQLLTLTPLLMNLSQGLLNHPYPERNHCNSDTHFLRSTPILSFHQLVGLPRGLPVIKLYALLPSSVLTTCPAHLILKYLIIQVSNYMDINIRALHSTRGQTRMNSRTIESARLLTKSRRQRKKLIRWENFQLKIKRTGREWNQEQGTVIGPITANSVSTFPSP